MVNFKKRENDIENINEANSDKQLKSIFLKQWLMFVIGSVSIYSIYTVAIAFLISGSDMNIADKLATIISVATILMVAQQILRIIPAAAKDARENMVKLNLPKEYVKTNVGNLKAQLYLISGLLMPALGFATVLIL